MYEAIIFDFFGVIQADPYQRWLSRHGFKRQGDFADVSKAADSNFITMQQFFERLSELSGQTVEEIQEVFYEDKFVDEEMVSLIKGLKNNYKIGLLSNSRGDYLRPILKTHDIIDLFDEVIISSEIQVIKPNPEIFEIALRKMNLDPGEAIFIDDNQHNTDAAQESGIQSIFYTDLVSLKERLTKLGVKI